ncbi:Phenylacetic acid catabolic protein [Halobaculum sp. CBA1158]|uniref:1,2-phenylacetyl-CoA epoxidase subunit PaaC n=1 Tax=Halobaculum sp. CBA1158 TaxID=2904243 RepID=UPI002AA29EB1|nr:Phenylacetic acid catabolic protein [Halobaculum sp. CBA1158]
MAAKSPPESEEKLQRQIQNGRMIESVAEMTPGYRDAVVTPLKVNADIELMSAPALFEQAMNAPSLDARNAELSTIQDEVGHSYISLRLLRNLGVDIDEYLYEREPEEWRSAYAFEMYLDDFAEQTVFHAFLDRGGLVLLSDIYENTSYAPWKRALLKVEKEEQFHIRHGETWFRRLANKNGTTKRKVQDAVDWLFPMGLELFGFPDDLKTRTEQLDYGIKGLSNDELRQEWMSHVVPLCEEHDIDVPAHYDADADEYVLEFDFPVAFTDEEKRWHFDDPVSWDDVLDRWRSGGPARDDFVEMIQTGDIYDGVIGHGA